MYRAVILLTLFAALGAHAQDKEKDLETQLKIQRARLEALEKQMEDLKANQATASARRKTESEQQKTLLTLEYSGGFKMFYKDPNSGNKRFALQIKGKIQIDGKVRLDGSDRKHGSSTLNTFRERRSEFSIKGTVYTYWHFIVTLDLENGENAVTAKQDIYIENDYIKQARFRIGQMKMPWSLERNTSSARIKVLERSMIVNLTAPSRNLGVMMFGKVAGNRLLYWVAVGNGNKNARSDNDDFKHGWARLVARPFAGDKDSALHGLHFGVYGGYGKTNNLAPGSEHGARVSTAVGTRLIEYASGIVIDGEIQRLGGEFAYMNGPFMISAEYMTMREELADRFAIGALEQVNRRSIRWRGGHVTLSYFLTGEKASWGKPKVLNPMEPGQPGSGTGAWELNARYDTIEVNKPEGDLEGFFLVPHRPSRIHQIMAGVDWYPNPNVRISLNWQHAWWNRAIKDDDAIIGIGTSRPQHQDSLIFRVQLEF